MVRRFDEIAEVIMNTVELDTVVKVNGDAANRFRRSSDGKHEWGDGTNPPDVVLERTSAGVLQFTSGSFNGSGAPVVLAGSTTITQALHSGRVLLMTGTGAAKTQTLPAATGSGARYLFVVGAVNTSNHVIAVPNGTDYMRGVVNTCSIGETPDLLQPWITANSGTVATESDTITLNGTTKGGLSISDWVELIDIAANVWLVRSNTTSSGTEANPFSAAV